MLKSQSGQDAKSEPQRPASPMSGVPTTIFKPFPQDMCGNPNAYFPGGKMKKWQRNQVIEASLHCCQWAIFSKSMKIKDRKLKKFKR